MHFYNYRTVWPMNYQHLFCNLHIYHIVSLFRPTADQSELCMVSGINRLWPYWSTRPFFLYKSFRVFFFSCTSCDAISQKREARSWEQTSVVFTSCHMHKCFVPDSSHFLLQTDFALSLKNNQNGNMRLSGHEEKYIHFVDFGINCLFKDASSV